MYMYCYWSVNIVFNLKWNLIIILNLKRETNDAYSWRYMSCNWIYLHHTVHNRFNSFYEQHGYLASLQFFCGVWSFVVLFVPFGCFCCIFCTWCINLSVLGVVLSLVCIIDISCIDSQVNELLLNLRSCFRLSE